MQNAKLGGLEKNISGLSFEASGIQERKVSEKEEKIMKTLWARVGMEVKISDEEYGKIQSLLSSANSEDEKEARKIMSALFASRGEFSGDSYMPRNDVGGCVDNPNEHEFDLLDGDEWKGIKQELNLNNVRSNDMNNRLSTLLYNAISLLEESGCDRAQLEYDLGITAEEYDAVMDDNVAEFPILSKASDYEYLKTNLSVSALSELEQILSAYDNNRIDFELVPDKSGYTADFRLIVNDEAYEKTGLEAVALKWHEGIDEDVDHLIECFLDEPEYKSYRFTVDYNEKGKLKSFQIGVSAAEKPDSKWLAQKISNWFSVHYKGSLDKAISSVEGIDVHIQDSKGEYVDSDEIYGQDLKDLFGHLKKERYKLIVDDEVHYAMLSKEEVNLINKDIAGALNCQHDIVDETGEKIETGIIDYIEKAEKPGLDSVISSAEKKVQGTSENELTHTDIER